MTNKIPPGTVALMLSKNNITHTEHEHTLTQLAILGTLREDLCIVCECDHIGFRAPVDFKY